MAGSVMTCPSCHGGNPAGARFCGSCGRSLELPCPSCATQLPPNARFCFNCGYELRRGSTADLVGRPAQAVVSTIAEQLRAPTAGPGERRTITLLFCDVKDSTATAERLDPEDWSAIMRRALDRFIQPVERYGGTVARILGDAILAYFGAPVAHEDDPQRAVLTGLAIVDGCRELTADVRRRFGIPFDVRVGINTGLVVVGDVGSALYGEYAALGDAANVAARMEQTAEPGTVRIAETTHRLVAPLFDVVPVGPVQIKGRSQPVTAYHVLGPSAAPGPLRGIPGLSSPLVGRDPEFARLTAALAGLRDGRGGIVSVIGEAGIGKSRLVTEFARLARDEVTWIEGRCFSYETTTPYAPFTRALESFFGLQAGDDPQRRYERLAERMTELVGAEGRRHAAHLATVLGAAIPADAQTHVRYLEPPVLRRRIFETVATLIDATAARAPVVLMVEDLHWADGASVDLVEALLPLADRHPVLLLLCFRPDRSEPSWRVHETANRDFPHRYTAVELRPLAHHDVSRLAANLLRLEGPSPAVREVILRKAEGNPFFVEEVIRSLLDSQVVVREGDRFVATEDIDDVQVPDTLVGVLMARLDALDPTARRVMQTAAVIGRDFDQDMLAELVDRGVPLGSVLAELERRELVVQTAAHTYSFKHALTRDTAHDTLLLTVRRDTHRMVGKLIEERQPDRVNELAHHFLEADEPLRALPYLVDAGDRAFRAFAMADATRLYRQALRIWVPGQEVTLARRAYEGLGGARMFLGDLPGALDAFARMEQFAVEQRDASARTSALNKQGMAHLVGTGDIAEAERVLLAARGEALRSQDATGLAEFHVGFCVLNTVTGRLDVAAENLGEAAQVCFTLDPYHRNFGLTHYATTLLYQTRLDEARAAFQRAWAQARKDDDKQHLSDLLLLEGQLELLAGNGEAGLARALDGVALAAEIGAYVEEASGAWMAGTLAVRLGRYETAAALFERSVAISRQTGFFGVAAGGLTGLAVVHQAVHGPRSERVTDLLAQARTALGLPMGGFTLGTVHADTARVLLREGELAEAATAARAALEMKSATMLLVRPEALLCWGYVALAQGDRDAGVVRLAEAAAYAEERGLRHHLPRTLLGSAVTAFHEGDEGRLVDRLEQADRAAAQMRLRDSALEVRTTGADLLRTVGLHDSADDFRRRAAQSIAEIAALMNDADLRAAFLRSHTLVAR